MAAFDLLADAHAIALRFLGSLPGRRVAASEAADALRSRLAVPLPVQGSSDRQVLAELAAAVEPGLVASAGPRYFGFVTGGSLPVAVAADWLTSAWDQNAFGYVMSPAASVVEEVCAAWLLDLLNLPRQASVGFVTGGQMANFVCLCAARDEVLRKAGIDVEQDGLASSDLTVFVGAQGHATIDSALRMLGIGRRQVVRVASDGQGRMQATSLVRALEESTGPRIVCAQAGNVNTGAFDPLRELAALAHAHDAWLHVDGAFGLWACAHPDLHTLVDGCALADSWSVDGHKWLNVPYDSGFAIVAHPRAHHAAMRIATGAYLVRGERGERDGNDWAPESSRRARAFAVYAALRSLGREGVVDLIGRSCALAQRMAQGLVRDAGAVLMNEVVLNQVLVRFEPVDSSDPALADAHTRTIIERVQEEGTCWVGPTVYAGRAAMRISISNWSTTERDVDQAVAAIARASHS